MTYHNNELAALLGGDVPPATRRPAAPGPSMARPYTGGPLAPASPPRRRIDSGAYADGAAIRAMYGFLALLTLAVAVPWWYYSADASLRGWLAFLAWWPGWTPTPGVWWLTAACIGLGYSMIEFVSWPNSRLGRSVWPGLMAQRTLGSIAVAMVLLAWLTNATTTGYVILYQPSGSAISLWLIEVWPVAVAWIVATTVVPELLLWFAWDMIKRAVRV